MRVQRALWGRVSVSHGGGGAGRGFSDLQTVGGWVALIFISRQCVRRQRLCELEFQRFVRSLERFSKRKARVFVFKHVCSACDNKRRDPTIYEMISAWADLWCRQGLGVFVRHERVCLCGCVSLKCVWLVPVLVNLHYKFKMLTWWTRWTFRRCVSESSNHFKACLTRPCARFNVYCHLWRCKSEVI